MHILKLSGTNILIPVKMYPLSNAITRHHLWDNDFQCCPSIWTGIFLCSQGSLSETAYRCWPATLKGFAAFYGQRQWCPSDHGIPPSNLDAATSASDLTFLCFSSQSCETEDKINSALGDHRKDKMRWHNKLSFQWFDKPVNSIPATAVTAHPFIFLVRCETFLRRWKANK